MKKAFAGELKNEIFYFINQDASVACKAWKTL